VARVRASSRHCCSSATRGLSPPTRRSSTGSIGQARSWTCSGAWWSPRQLAWRFTSPAAARCGGGGRSRHSLGGSSRSPRRPDCGHLAVAVSTVGQPLAGGRGGPPHVRLQRYYPPAAPFVQLARVPPGRARKSPATSGPASRVSQAASSSACCISSGQPRTRSRPCRTASLTPIMLPQGERRGRRPEFAGDG
jgi:hypothetical protein